MPKTSHKQNHHFYLALFIWFICCSFYMLQYFLRVSVSGMEIDLIKNFHFDAITLCNVTNSYFYSFIIMQIPAGILINRFGNRHMLIFASLCSILGCFLFAFVSQTYLIELARFIMGIASAFALPITLSLIHKWFNERQFVILNGLTKTVGTLGAILGNVPLMLLIDWVDISYVMIFCGILGTIILIVGYFGIYNSPTLTKHETKHIHWKESLIHLKQTMKNKTVWIAALYSAAIYAPIPAFAIIWGTPFLIAKYGISAKLADTASTIMFVGIGFGALFVAWISNIIRNHVLAMRLGSLISLLLVMAIFYIHQLPLSWAFIFIFLLGISLSCNTLPFISVRNHVDKNNNAIAFAFTYMFQLGGGALSLPIIGWLLETNWTGKIVHNIHIYHLPNYHKALLIIPVFIAISLLLSFLLKKDPQEA